MTVETAPCDRAMCRRFDTIPACDRLTVGQTDGRTDRQNCRSYSTALAMRATIATRRKN